MATRAFNPKATLEVAEDESSAKDIATGQRLYPLRDTLGNVINISQVKGATPYDYLVAGEEYIREHGWMKTNWYEGAVPGHATSDADIIDNPPSACALGGVMLGGAVLQKKMKFPMHVLRNLQAATKALYDSIPEDKKKIASAEVQKEPFGYLMMEPPARREAVVSAYNDLPDTTANDIFKLFEEAKKIASREQTPFTKTFDGPVFVEEGDNYEKYAAWIAPRVDQHQDA